MDIPLNHFGFTVTGGKKPTTGGGHPADDDLLSEAPDYSAAPVNGLVITAWLVNLPPHVAPEAASIRVSRPGTRRKRMRVHPLQLNWRRAPVQVEPAYNPPLKQPNSL